jgi:putative PEP-CTERM system histidine kinase
MPLQIALSISAAFLTILYSLYLLLKAGGQRAGAYALICGLILFGTLELFDLLALMRPGEVWTWKKGALWVESLLPFVWILFGQTWYRQGRTRDLSPFGKIFLLLSGIFPLAVLLVPLDRFFYSPDFAEERLLFLGQPGYYFYIGLLLYLTAALVNLERTLASLPLPDRWRVKFEIVGAGLLLAMGIVYYSQGLLYRSLDMALLPARSAALIAAGKIVVSRDMAFRSVVIMTVGLYLVGLGLAGEGMRYLSGTSRNAIFVLVILLGGVAVVVVLLSETVRRKIKVFLHKNFYRNKYDYRSQWLQFTRSLSSAASEEEMHREILAFFCATFALRSAVLYLEEAESGHYPCVGRWEKLNSVPVVFKGSSLLSVMDNRPWVLDRENDDPSMLEKIREFFTANDIRFVVPLQSESRLEGLVALGGPINEKEVFNFEDYDLMKVLARQATSALLSLKLSSQLATARELAAIGKVSAFVLHDLKNLVSSLGLVVDNARDYLDDPEFRVDMFDTLTKTVLRMKNLVARLKNLEEKSSLSLEMRDLMEVVSEGARMANGEVLIRGEAVMAPVDPVEIQKVVLNLVLNALEASPQGGAVSVAVGRDRQAFFKVTDQGCGMTEEFLQTHLFKPFATTKKKGFGIGLYQCKNIVEAHGGQIEVRSRPNQGTEFIVWLPLAGMAEVGSSKIRGL